MSHTFAILEVSPLVFQAIKLQLIAANYQHVIDDKNGVIDLHGLALKREVSAVDSSGKDLVEAAAELKEAIADAKAKLLLALQQAVKVGYHMRQAQKAYFAAKTGKQELLIESKRLEGAFDRRCAELKTMGVDFK
jgi:hypothetical protein